ncbi:related to pre-mRNA-splicing factor cwc23 [Phialocephala subalpina]|uniref:Related to pre-mRNA-splicing factor cwc23 n=1 Tax=Phialocephala subalpina TaxID=576137 RepID=A0A1L7WX24_9HELO|nr:related to pre-mRNA-splicing factor cwc23 [Phialocephala subalpina]
MSNNDLLKWVTSEIDFYELLGITFENCSESELRRAYRKTALKYHPDKVGKDFDPDKYELFQAANDVLSDPELKAKYDNHRQAKIHRQRANELFEGKRRQMKEDLEARERGGVFNGGVKRPREEDTQAQELRKLAEEGRKRRAARQSMMAESVASSSPAPAPRKPSPEEPPKETHAEIAELQEEDEVERLERLIREKEEAKAKRKADKKARKSGVFVPADSPSVPGQSAEGGPNLADRDTSTPIKRPDIFRGLKADDKSSASPKFSFSPAIPTPKKNDFAATMARLKAAEKQRLEDEIRQQESKAA